MDVKAQAADTFVLLLTSSEAADIAALVDEFTHWDVISSRENSEPMSFMLAFGRDCRFALSGLETMRFPVQTGQVPLSKAQVLYLSNFIKAAIDQEGKKMGFLKRQYLKLAWKTLRNRV